MEMDRKRRDEGTLSYSARVIGLAVGLFMTGLFGAQMSAQVKPGTQRGRWASEMNAGDNGLFYRMGLVCGAGASMSSVGTKPTVQCGGTFGMGVLDLDAGVMGPQVTQSEVSGYFSTNFWVPLDFKSPHGVPVLLGGYTRMFETGHALDYGVGYVRPIGGDHYLQFEARDYWAFSNPSQHNIVFRVGWFLGLPNP